jgi:tripartite motif-containing protein 71
VGYGVCWGRMVGLLGVLACALGVGGFTGVAHASGSVVFGGLGEGAGQINVGVSLAVDDSVVGGSAGDVYVADRNNQRVDKFGPGGEFLMAWGWGVADGKEEFERCGPGVPTPTAACHVGRAGSGAGQFSNPVGVAVDSVLPSVSGGDVYVVDSGNHRVEKFSEDG